MKWRNPFRRQPVSNPYTLESAASLMGKAGAEARKVRERNRVIDQCNVTRAKLGMPLIERRNG